MWKAPQFALLLACAASPVCASNNTSIDTTQNSLRRVLNVPKLERPPALEDFSGMEPDAFAGKMEKAQDFIQADPKDGAPASQRTDAYLGYDAKNLYVAFLCFQTDAKNIRAHMTKREGALDD